MDQQVAICPGPDGEEIAFATVGSGPPVVLAAWWTSHLELDWQNPELRAFLLELARHHTVVRYDRPGVGMSERIGRTYDLATEVGHLEAVVNAIGVDEGEQVDLLGISCGGPPCVQLASQRPDIVRKLVFFGSYADGQDISDPETRAVLKDLVKANWGLGSQTLTAIFLPDSDAVTARRFTSAQRHTAAADVAANLLQLTFDMDVSGAASAVEHPALVLHRSHDYVVEPAQGEALADLLPNAEFRSLPGKAHLPWAEAPVELASTIAEYLSDAPRRVPVDRQLATVLFVDIVESTRLLTQLGDDVWRQRLDMFNDLVRTEVESQGGEVVKDTGDGVLATFGLPSAAIDVAVAIRRPCRQLGLGIRAGINTGELERRGDDVTGRAVVVASRLCDLAPPDSVYASATTNELAAGRGFRTVEIGPRELNGISTPVVVYEAEPPERSSVEATPGLDHPRLRREGALWSLDHAGQVVTLPHTKGLADIAELIAKPGRDIDSVELMDGTAAPARSTGADMLDETAVTAYRHRLGEIESELDLADERGDATTSAHLDEERAAIISELRSASGLGQRQRRMGDDVERARKAVTARVRDAIRRIDDVHPTLGAHLAEHITTGRHCRYR